MLRPRLLTYLVVGSVAFGYRGNYRAAGVDPYEEGDDCPQCTEGTLKLVANRLRCKACGWAADTADGSA